MASSELTVDYRRQEGTPAFDGPVISVVTLGLLCTFLGLYALDIRYNFMSVDPVTMTVLIFCLSCLVLYYAYRAIMDRVITDSVMLIIAAFTSILYTGYILDGYSILMYSVLLFAAGFIICALVYAMRDERFMGIVSLLGGVALFFKILVPNYGGLAATIILCVIGFSLLVTGCLALAGHPVGNLIKRSQAQDMSDEDFPKVFVATVGLLVFVALTFSLGLADFDGSSTSVVFIMFKFLVSALCMAVGAYAIYHDIVNDGCLFFIVSLSSLVSSFGMLLFGSAPLQFDFIPGILLFILSIAMLKDREYYEGITSFKYGLIFIIGVFAPGSTILGIILTITKVSITGFAFYTLIKVDGNNNINVMEALEKLIGGKLPWNR